MRSEFPIVPASSGALWMCGALAALLVSLTSLFGWLAWSSRHARVVLGPDGLKVANVMYGRTIPFSHLKTDAARRVEEGQSEYRLVLRTNGAGLPGFAAGWFRRKGGEKVLAFVTDWKHVVYVPTTDGYSLMVSVTDPEGLVEALKRHPGHA